MRHRIPSLSRFALLLTCCLCAALTEASQAQTPVYDVVYRPPGVHYRVHRYPHFDLIYQVEAAKEARELAYTLEHSLAQTAALFGIAPGLHMPVVLNRYNDRANGFVTPFPFKQEIEDVAIKGNILSPRFQSWIQTVAPHELVHAVHADYRNGFGLVGVVRWFAPDLARSLNLTIPPGISEGAAVYRESRIEPGAGRLNHAFFTMRFRAAMLSKHPWRLAQMLEVPAYSRPFDRYYLGGSHLFSYLAERDSTRFFQKATALQYRFPFFGYGINLWYGTGRTPFQLGKEFRSAMRERLAREQAALGTRTVGRRLGGARGLVHRRPRWLDDHTLLAYVQGYDVRPGFYRIEAETGARTPVSTQDITEDQYFSLTSDRQAVLFSRYLQDPLATTRNVAEVFRLDLQTGRVRRLTHGGRAFAPVEGAGGTTWALRNEGPYNRWVSLEPGGDLRPVSPEGLTRYVSLVPAPLGGEVAVVLNVRGRQGLFRARIAEDGSPVMMPWIGFADGSVYDAVWSPDGRYLIFSADPGGLLNIFALDTRSDRLLKLTNVPFGAFEPDLSPDGRTLVYVDYVHERFDLVRMPFRPEEAEEIPRSSAHFPEDVASSNGPALSPAPTISEGADRAYSPFRYLRPRMLYPTLHYQDEASGPDDARLGLGGGMGIQGADPLQQWAYSMEGYYQAGRLWGDMELRTARWPVRPSLRLFDTPSTVLALGVDENGDPVRTFRARRERRGAELGFLLPVTLSSNTFRSSFAVALRGRYQQERFFDRNGRALSGFDNRFTLRPAAVLGYRLQANTRDLVPNTGMILSAAGEYDASADRGTPRRAVIVQYNAYLPFLMRNNVGLRLHAGMLAQNQGSVFNLDRFMPRGQEDVFLGRGTFFKYGLEYTRPLWYIDNGFVLLPLYLKALFAYGFAETLHPSADFADRVSSIGGGVGLQFRVFYLINFELRVGRAFRIEQRRWDWTYR